MKLIFAVLYVSRTMGLTRCYKTEVFFTFIITNSSRRNSIHVSVETLLSSMSCSCRLAIISTEDNEHLT